MPDSERSLKRAFTDENSDLRELVFDYARERLQLNPPPLDGSATPESLQKLTGNTITESGLGGAQALNLFANSAATATISVDHPNFLSFIPCAPTEAARLFDLIVSASSIYGGSWLEGAGAIHLENQVLRFLADEVGLPESAGGLFVQGGSLGNLSALVTARHKAAVALEEAGKVKKGKWAILCSQEAHSSLKAAARVMDIDIVWAPVDSEGRLTGAAVKAAIEASTADTADTAEPKTIFAIVATSGTTNFGIVDDLQGIGDVAKANNIWFHIDGAYGLAGILSPEDKWRYQGSHLADSFVVDPHKWLFAPYDACALVYREPEFARRAHSQHGEYLEILQVGDEWNPSDYAFNLTRRCRGLPLWFSLATHGVEAYRNAIASSIQLARRIANEIEKRPNLALVRQPELSVVAFTKDGWSAADYTRWSDLLLGRQQAFVVPSSHLGKPMTRFAILNPETTYEDLVAILNSMDEMQPR